MSDYAWTKMYEIQSYTVNENSIEDTYRYTKLVQTLCEHYTKNNTIQWPYIASPWFTDVELNDLSEHMIIHRVTDQIKELDHMNYKNRVQNIQNSIKLSADQEEKDKLEKDLLHMGWNPNIEYNPQNEAFARDRICSEYNKELSNSIFIDCIAEVNSCGVTQINENRYGALTPYHMCIHESGQFSMVNGYLRLNLNRDNFPKEGNMTIYEIFAEAYPEGVYIDHCSYQPIGGVFPVPEKVIAIREYKNLYHDMGHSLKGKKPIIKKVYSGPMNQIPIGKIDTFAEKCFLNPHESRSFDLNSMIIPSEKYLCINLLSDQL